MMRLKMSLAYRTGNIFLVKASFLWSQLLQEHHACTACSFREGLKLCSSPDLSICSLEITSCLPLQGIGRLLTCLQIS
jgi:hypothetical protein